MYDTSARAIAAGAESAAASAASASVAVSGALRAEDGGAVTVRGDTDRRAMASDPELLDHLARIDMKLGILIELLGEAVH